MPASCTLEGAHRAGGYCLTSSGSEPGRRWHVRGSYGGRATSRPKRLLQLSLAPTSVAAGARWSQSRSVFCALCSAFGVLRSAFCAQSPPSWPISSRACNGPKKRASRTTRFIIATPMLGPTENLISNMTLSIQQLENLGIEPGLWGAQEPEAERDRDPEPDLDIKPDTKQDIKPDIQPYLKPDTKPDTQPDIETDIQPYLEPDTQPDIKTDTQPDIKPYILPDSTSDVKLDLDAKPQPEPVPSQEQKPPRRAPKRKAIENVIAPPSKLHIKVAQQSISHEALGIKDIVLGQKFLRLPNEIKKTQISIAEIESKSFILVAYLGLVKVFEAKRSEVVEVKTINKQNSDIAIKLITCLHYSDSKIYIAYLWGCDEIDTATDRPYVEVRDIEGNQKGRTKIYDKDSYIDAIQSDQNFIYVMSRNLSASSTPLFLYRKDAYNSISYTIDLSCLFEQPLVASYFVKSSYKENTSLTFVSANTNSILITETDALRQVPIHNFKFNDQYDIISMEKLYKLYIILRRNKIGRSKLELCYCSSDSKAFIHDTTLDFDCHLIDIKPSNNKLYLLGSKLETKSYEVGCLDLSTLRPAWVVSIADASANSSLVVDKNRNILVITGQTITRVNVYPSEKTTVLNYEIHRNKFIIDKKLGPFSL